MNRIRIYTEDLGDYRADSILEKYFDGFTVFPSEGVWKGTKEHSICFEILTAEDQDLEKAKSCAKEIKLVNKRECVLVTWEKSIVAEFV